MTALFHFIPRLFTHGYDFFAPPEAVVYHLWTRSHRPAFFQDAVQAADRASEGLKTVGTTGVGKAGVILNSKQLVHDLRIQSEQRIRSLLGVGNVLPPDMTCPIERRYGLGDVRSLSEFENRIGVSVSAQTIEDLGPPAGMRFCSDTSSEQNRIPAGGPRSLMV